MKKLRYLIKQTEPKAVCQPSWFHVLSHQRGCWVKLQYSSPLTTFNWRRYVVSLFSRAPLCTEVVTSPPRSVSSSWRCPPALSSCPVEGIKSKSKGVITAPHAMEHITPANVSHHVLRLARCLLLVNDVVNQIDEIRKNLAAPQGRGYKLFLEQADHYDRASCTCC